ncbi:MAG: CAP domain-containing protein [Pseudomonadota bacterium]
MAAHNDLRARIGSPPMQWDPVLADHALLRSQELVRLGDLVHAPRQGRENERENIVKAPNSYSTAETFGRWTREYADFKPGVFPNVCVSGGDCNGVLHLTQMGWPTVLRVGCGSTSDGSFTWTVCRYPKGANQDGKEIGTPTAAADGLKAVEAANSWVRARPVGGDYGQASGARTPANADAPKDPMPPIKSRPGGAWYVGGDFGAMIVEDIDFDFRPRRSGADVALSYMVDALWGFGDDDGKIAVPTTTYTDYGYDGALFVGYDLGAFRIEAETAYKHADVDAYAGSSLTGPYGGIYNDAIEMFSGGNPTAVQQPSLPARETFEPAPEAKPYEPDPTAKPPLDVM